MNEELFVEKLKNEFRFSRGIGIGDDCSVVKKGNLFQLVTSDMLVENIHFSLKYFSFREVALKALAVNLSDIAAMGGKPEYFYLNVALPMNKFSKKIDEFFSGIREGCEKWNIELAGGDISNSDIFVVSVTMLGTTDKPVMRNGAKKGDLICITGRTGESFLGLKLLEKDIDVPYYTDKHKSVEPELENGAILKDYATSMIDVSDGLIKDLFRIIKASELHGCMIDYTKISVSKEYNDLCRKHGINIQRAILSGGEDFILLFTIGPENVKRLLKEFKSFSIIGDIGDYERIIIKNQDNNLSFKTGGFDHFVS